MANQDSGVFAVKNAERPRLSRTTRSSMSPITRAYETCVLVAYAAFCVVGPMAWELAKSWRKP